MAEEAKMTIQMPAITILNVSNYILCQCVSTNPEKMRWDRRVACTCNNSSSATVSSDDAKPIDTLSGSCFLIDVISA